MLSLRTPQELILVLTLGASVLFCTFVLVLNPIDAMIAMSWLGLLVTSSTWLISGRTSVTSAGVLSVALGLFGYFPPLYYHHVGDVHSLLPLATTLLLGTNLGTVLLSLIFRRPSVERPQALRCASSGDAVGLFLYGTLFLLGGALASTLWKLPATGLAAAVSFVGVVAIVYSAVFSKSPIRPRSLAVPILAILVYMAFLFNTGGRLVIAGLVFTTFIFFAQRTGVRHLKLGFLLSMIPALIVAARQRSRVIEVTRGTDETGLESVVWPMDRLAQLIGLFLEGHLSPSWGDTLIPTILFWVPRRLWPEKPVGLGAELVPVLKPHLMGVGHSEAATALGEWIWNFGLLGIVFLPFVTVGLLAFIDKLEYNAYRTKNCNSRILAHIALALITAGMLDLFWVGTFGFATRTGMRLLALALLGVAMFILPFSSVRWPPTHSEASPTSSHVTTKPGSTKASIAWRSR